MREANNNFATSDFWLAATLMALEEKLMEIKRDDRGRATFVFRFSKNILKTVEKYQRQELKLEPQNLFVQNKLLKNQLYGDYQNK